MFQSALAQWPCKREKCVAEVQDKTPYRSCGGSAGPPRASAPTRQGERQPRRRRRARREPRSRQRPSSLRPFRDWCCPCAKADRAESTSRRLGRRPVRGEPRRTRKSGQACVMRSGGFDSVSEGVERTEGTVGAASARKRRDRAATRCRAGRATLVEIKSRENRQGAALRTRAV